MALSVPAPAYQLRAAQHEDADFLWRLRQQVMRDVVEATWGPWEDTQQRQFFDRGFVPRETSIIVVDDKPAGRISVARSHMEYFLGIVELLPEAQGRGLGSAIMRDLQEEARQVRLPIRLQVIKANTAALRLYTRLGFRPTGETKTHQLMLWHP
jgi:ribosomal protein S18 acetylase RimI-like enzyme